jgi:hypothetical protein
MACLPPIFVTFVHLTVDEIFASLFGQNIKILNSNRMSFQAYLDNIKTKTGNSADQFKKLAEKKGFVKKDDLTEGTKAGDIIKWLKEDYDLGHGHAMALGAYFKSKRE